MSNGKWFSRAEIAAVIEAVKIGEPCAQVAERLGRNVGSVRNIASQYGWSFRAERKKWRVKMQKDAERNRRMSVAAFIEAGKQERARARA